MRNIRYLFWIFHLVNGVSGVEELQLMVGDSVTLNSAETPSKETIQWLFETKRIAEIREGSRDPQYYDERFKDQLELDKKTGSLTIKNINTYHSGQYRQNIADINRKNIAIQVRDEKPKVSVKEGKNVFLITGVKDIQTYDLILNLNGRTIAKIDKNYQSRNNSSYSRLLLDSLSGSLIMSDSATTDTGDYDLTMSSSTYSLQRTISVTVSSPDSGVATGTEAGIVVGLLVFLWCLQLK